jgi:hypothetical protein
MKSFLPLSQDSKNDFSSSIELQEKSSNRKKYNIFKNKNVLNFEIQSHTIKSSEDEEEEDSFTKQPIFHVKNPEQTYLTLEQALQYSGDNSTYPKRVLYLICAYWVWYSSIIMGFSLFMGTLNYNCTNSDHLIFECTQEEYCALPQNFVSIKGKDISSEFGLNCNKSFLKNIFYSLLLFVSAISSVPFSLFSEKVGRKTSLIFACFISSISLIFAGLSNSFGTYMFFLLLSGTGFGGLEVISRVYTAEISANRFRINSNVALNVTWAVGEVFLGFLGIFIKNWR